MVSVYAHSFRICAHLPYMHTSSVYAQFPYMRTSSVYAQFPYMRLCIFRQINLEVRGISLKITF